MQRHEQEFGFGSKLLDQRSCLESVNLRETDVQQDNIWLKFLRSPNRVKAVRGFTDDIEARLQGKHRANLFAHKLIIVDDEHTD